MLPEYKKDAELRLKVAAGHLEAVRRMVQEDAYCIDLMKQLSAVQGTLQKVQQTFLRNHLSSCVSDAIKKGTGEAIINELMTALKYDTSLIDGRGGSEVAGEAVPGPADEASAEAADGSGGETSSGEAPGHCCAGGSQAGESYLDATEKLRRKAGK